jgi:hypothetical protein
MFHVTLSQTGPAWDPTKPLEEQSGWSEHAVFMDGLVTDGWIILGGPTLDRRVVHAMEAESEEAIRARFAQDPWSESHLRVESIEPWTIRLDSRE